MPEGQEGMPKPENGTPPPEHFDSFQAYLSYQKGRGEGISLYTIPPYLIQDSPYSNLYGALVDTAEVVRAGHGQEVYRRLLELRDGLREVSETADDDSKYKELGKALLHLSNPLLASSLSQEAPKEREDQRQRSRQGINIPEFKGQTETERDGEKIDWVRERLEKMERRKRGLSRLEQRRFLYVIESIGDEELKESLYSEITLRQELQGLVLQWETASGSEKAIGEMLGKSRLLTLEQLMDMSNLAEAKDGEKRVSLSVQISRAMNLYLNFLGVWAEACDDKEARRIKEEESKKPLQKGETEDNKKKNTEKLVFDHAKMVAKSAQKAIAGLKPDDEVKINGLEEQGIKASFLKETLKKFPKELVGYRSDFITKVKSAKDTDYFDLTEVFGKCIFVEEVTARDTLWTKSIVAELCGSISAENMALWMLDLTGETDILNVIWKDGAYRFTDFQKLTRMEERRRREYRDRHSFGYEANLGKFPEQSGQGWFENAKIKMLDNMPLDPDIRDNVKDIIRGIRRNKEGAVVSLVDPIPFHQVDWNLLPRDTYIANFLLPNMRYYATFAACMRADLDYKDFPRNSLRGVNKVFKTSFGKTAKEDLKKKYGDDWPKYSPWVWYAIGGISEHNPYGIRLPGMTKDPSPSLRWKTKADATKNTPGYDKDCAENLVGSYFLTEKEMAFVNKYIQTGKF